ncbi:cathepsin L-like isoform X2 [Narcine bancroftii]|uniref:cathepsin L-like isoform X2 n=1 Tax=Narcine bancroftii TaxID=1343680 RepID=UPI00383141D1
MSRLLAVACLLAAHLLRSQGSLSGSLPDELVEDEDEDMELLRAEFEKFKVTYKKLYDGEEEEENRFRIFEENLVRARKWQQEDRGTAVYGVNKFSDMSDEEFDQFYLNPLIMSNSSWPQEHDWDPEDAPLANRSVPRCWNWRRMGIVTPVKNQRRCGSCWAFGVTANVESLWALKTKRLISMSEQELLDCDTYDKACKGGYPYSAFSSLIKLGGMMSERAYRYRARKGSCRFRRRRCVAKIQSYRNLRPHECYMKHWVATNGPIVITMNAAALKGYKRGIIRPNQYNCPSSKMNHVLMVVGYGVRRNIPYWTLKNCWGKNWGENGYFRIARNEKACGINKYPTSAII